MKKTNKKNLKRERIKFIQRRENEICREDFHRKTSKKPKQNKKSLSRHFFIIDIHFVLLSLCV